MKRGLVIYLRLLVLVGVFLISGVLAQAEVCIEEGIPLFTPSQKIYLDDSLNSVKTTIRGIDLPSILSQGTFSGNVKAEYVQSIEIGSYPKVVFAKQPTSSDDPSFGLRLSTVRSNYFYKDSITFSRAVDFTSPSSVGKNILLFGKNLINLGQVADHLRISKTKN